ncbi:MAG TPA: efflux RND transporter periplasmic adaptor subunit [Bacteroidales bacterium]|nr:efflux RND transporter periplasmic adaptor subunit [Bacteroidales bacterium]
MKKPLIITAIFFIAAFIFLFAFNKIASRQPTDSLFAETKKGEFEISVSVAGELIAETSLEIKAPDMSTGRDIRSSQIRIQDLVPEGTIVKKGDYIATLDRTELSNNLKDAHDRLTEFERSLEVRLLDTAVQLSGLRDNIKNQESNVEEREMTFRNSKYEAPTVIRQAEINLDQSRRVLEQIKRSYIRREAQLKTDINNQRFWISRIQKRVNDLEEVLAGFTITAPSSGMVIYKREWRGNKRKAGSMINPIDRVVATLPDLSVMLSKIYVSEVDISKIKDGQVAEIKVDAFPDKVFKAHVSYVANIGEKLPNTDEKVFEVHLKIDGSDPALRPSMTTGNKISIMKYNDAVYVPIECVQAGIDSIPFVYRKNGTKQVIIPGESNDKNIVIEKGLEPGSLVYVIVPEKAEKFKLAGEELIPELKEKSRIRKAELNASMIRGAN